MGKLESALDLAQKGFYVFALPENAKKEPPTEFYKVATRDPDKIKKIWANRSYNIGVSTTDFNDGEHLVAVDVDVKNGKKGEDTIFMLDLDGKVLPETFEQVTATGGKHLVYKTRRKLRQYKLGPDVDIRAHHGYILGAGSSIDGKFYSANNKEVANAPEWLENYLGEQSEKKAQNSKTPPKEIDQVRAVKRAVHYLSNEAPLAVEGQGGDQTTFAVAAAVKDYGVSAAVALELMTEHYNNRCTPPWSSSDLALKVERAYKYGREEIGANTPELDFDVIEKEKSPLEKLNEKHALIFVKGKHYVLWERESGDDEEAFDLMPEASFRVKYSTRYIMTKTGNLKPIANEWLRWPGRREYDGIVFSPGSIPDAKLYNLWRGFTYEPIPYEKASPEACLGVDLFKEHILKNVCHGDITLSRWLTGYFAHLIQKPGEKTRTALVFQGSQGTGKSFIPGQIGKLLGRHFCPVNNSENLIGNFNALIEGRLLMVMEEAFWAGDKKAEGRLKTLITAETITVEKKGVDARVAKNFVRLVLTSNEDWVVPASSDDRRYAVFKFSNERQNDASFFGQMIKSLNDCGGNSVLLHYLQNFDLSGIDVNTTPKTRALFDQKLESLPPISAWWYACLDEGRMICLEFSEDWEIELPKEKVREAYVAYLRTRNISGRHPDARIFSKLMKRLLPSIVVNQKAKGSHVFRFPPLEQARKEFEKHIGQKVPWNE